MGVGPRVLSPSFIRWPSEPVRIFSDRSLKNSRGHTDPTLASISRPPTGLRGQQRMAVTVPSTEGTQTHHWPIQGSQSQPAAVLGCHPASLTPVFSQVLTQDPWVTGSTGRPKDKLCAHLYAGASLDNVCTRQP